MSIGRPYTRIPSSALGRFVDSAPVGAHLEELLTLGMTQSMIARAAGVTERTLANIRRNAQPRCREKVAEAVLAVTPYPSKHQAIVLNTGARRRLEGLHVMGWSGRRLAADLCGSGPGAHKSITLWRTQPRINWESHVKIADLYERISHVDGGNTRTKAWAAQCGFVHPAMWDDVDDINESPTVDEDSGIPDEVIIERVLAGKWVGSIPDLERRVAYERLEAEGATSNEIADLLHVTQRTVVRYRAAA